MTTPFRSGQRLTAALLNQLFPDSVKLDEQEPTSTSFSFSSISQEYRHLRIIGSARGTTAATFTGLSMQVNGSGAATYDSQQITANNATVAGLAQTSGTSANIGEMAAASATSGACSTYDILIPNYRGTSFWKSWTVAMGLSTGSGATAMHIKGWQCQFRDTSPITSITIAAAAGNFATGSVFTLYGLRN